jgi:PAS domain-containing protein
LPLINQGKLIGVLYLENTLAPGVFTAPRIALLKLVASQAAISLENTRLYHDLAGREAKIRRLVDANIMGIVIWNFEGQIIDANEAFLRIVGYDREDLASGRVRWTDLTAPEWRDRDQRAMAEVKATGTVQQAAASQTGDLHQKCFAQDPQAACFQLAALQVCPVLDSSVSVFFGRASQRTIE